jgi:plastocyanin
VAETIDQGKTTTVKFKADKAGTYRVYCQLHPTHGAAELVVS